MSVLKPVRGFTIVELLIVIVIIAIIAAITIAAYNGIQDRARASKINTDLTTFSKAITAARISSADQATRYITGSTGTAGNCVNTASSVDIADQTAAATCWTAYTNALNTISEASNINIRGLVDPWGRPYFLDENEKEGSTTCGNAKDAIGVYPVPRAQASWATTHTRSIPYITPGC